MATDLAGTVIFITGASSGIGQATAEAFAKRGARLALAAFQADRPIPLHFATDGDNVLSKGEIVGTFERKAAN